MDSDPDFVSAYPRETLPACSCFEVDAGDLREVAKTALSLASNVGEAVASALMDGGICPAAMPSMLAIALSAAALDTAMARGRVTGVTGPLDLMPELRRVVDEVVRLMPMHVERAQRFALETDTMNGRAGRC